MGAKAKEPAKWRKRPRTSAIRAKGVEGESQYVVVEEAGEDAAAEMANLSPGPSLHSAVHKTMD